MIADEPKKIAGAPVETYRLAVEEGLAVFVEANEHGAGRSGQPRLVLR